MKSSIFSLSIFLIFTVSYSIGFLVRVNTNRIHQSICNPSIHSNSKSNRRHVSLSDKTDEKSLISESETSNMPIPKVPSTAWRWPPVWPFPDDYLSEVTTFSPKPISDVVLSYTSEHVSKFLPTESRVLEIGTEKYSLRENMQTQNIQKVTISDFLKEDADYSQEFDVIIFSSGIESISDPKNLFRKIWKALKPDGTCNLCFTPQPCDDIQKSTKMWTTMTEEQKLWIAGSYFQYAVVGGWTRIEGYDVLDTNVTSQMVFQKKDKNMDTAYVVNARKLNEPDYDDSTTTSKWFESNLQLTKNVDMSDIEYLALRLTEMAKTESNKSNFVNNCVARLSSIYDVLKNVNEVVLPKSIKAMLATLLINQWTGSEVQMLNLKRGLGLETPDDAFWAPVGALTTTLSAREKILLLADVVNYGQNDEKTAKFPMILEETLGTLRAKYPNEPAKVLESASTNLAVVEYLLSEKPNAFERIINFIQKSNENLIEKVSAISLQTTFDPKNEE